jgi:hypothetical protein
MFASSEFIFGLLSHCERSLQMRGLTTNDDEDDDDEEKRDDNRDARLDNNEQQPCERRLGSERDGHYSNHDVHSPGARRTAPHHAHSGRLIAATKTSPMMTSPNHDVINGGKR